MVLAMVQWKAGLPMLMAERFLKGAGWAEILLVGLYAGWISYKMADPANTGDDSWWTHFQGTDFIYAGTVPEYHPGIGSRLVQPVVLFRCPRQPRGHGQNGIEACKE
jgi:hypothetical protein